MDVLLVMVVLCFSIGFLLEKATGFIEKLKSDGSAKLGKGFKAQLSLVPIDNKNEACAPNTNSKQNDLD